MRNPEDKVNNKKIKVGDRVMGRYNDVKYTGTVKSMERSRLYIHITDCSIEDYDGSIKYWSCRLRPDGYWACADGCDDGQYILKRIKKLNKKNYIVEIITKNQ